MTHQVVTDKNSYESASGQSSESRKLQAGDLSYAESSKKAATKAKLEVDGITAEKAAAISQVSVNSCLSCTGHQCCTRTGYCAHLYFCMVCLAPLLVLVSRPLPYSSLV